MKRLIPIVDRYLAGVMIPNLSDYEQEVVYVSDIHDNAPIGIMPGITTMTCSSYQNGKCVLFSFHLELTSGLDQMLVRACEWVADRFKNSQGKMGWI